VQPPRIFLASAKFAVASIILMVCLNGCASHVPAFSVKPNCSGMSPNSLAHYDTLSQQFLDDATRNPLVNSGGNIVWGTRYYLESLLDAYEASGNAKYIQAFVETGTSVMKVAQSLSVLNAPDPSAPGSTIDSPLITVMGWPTQLGSFSQSVAIPTQTGQVSLNAQNLDPSNPNGPVYFQVTQQQDGSLLLAWEGATQTLETHTVRNVSDLFTLASAPLIEGQSNGRIKPTGLGLPAPGTYQVNSPIQTIWHEQTGGILLPFARLLLIAKNHPGLVAPATIAQWSSQILEIAASYEDEFVSDGNGGLLFQNPIWLPNALAGTYAAADYIAVEATMRMFLYALTGNARQFQIAKGLVIHQKNYHWQLSPEGWLLLKSWPCFISWSTRADAPVGSIWDAFVSDNTVPVTVEDGATFVDLFHHAKVLGLSFALGITPEKYFANKHTLEQYLFANTPTVTTRLAGILRGSYPTESAAASDPPSSSQYTFSGAWYVAPEVADEEYVNANWSWMLQYAQSPQGGPIGYFLRAWAMSEAAEYQICMAQ
jgi:hypothetical protein